MKQVFWTHIHFIMCHNRISIHTACHQRYVTFFSAQTAETFQIMNPNPEHDKSRSWINIQTLGIGDGTLCKHGKLSSCDQDSFLAANELLHAGKLTLVRVNSHRGIKLLERHGVGHMSQTGSHWQSWRWIWRKVLHEHDSLKSSGKNLTFF